MTVDTGVWYANCAFPEDKHNNIAALCPLCPRVYPSLHALLRRPCLPMVVHSPPSPSLLICRRCPSPAHLPVCPHATLLEPFLLVEQPDPAAHPEVWPRGRGPRGLQSSWAAVGGYHDSAHQGKMKLSLGSTLLMQQLSLYHHAQCATPISCFVGAFLSILSYEHVLLGGKGARTGTASADRVHAAGPVHRGGG